MTSESRTFFISYSRADSEFVLRLVKDLKAAGAAVWLDQLDIELSEEWDRAVQRALAGSSRMLVVLSPESAASPNVMDEVSFALEEKKTVIPILYRPCEIPFRLRRLQRMDFSGDYATALEALLSRLGVQLAADHAADSAAHSTSQHAAEHSSSQHMTEQAAAPQTTGDGRSEGGEREHRSLLGGVHADGPGGVHPEEKNAGGWRKLRQLWPVLPLLGILCALMLSDLDVMGNMPWSQNPCALTESEQGSLSAKMYLPLANWALRYTPTPSVAILLIDSTTRPAGLLTNTCESRAFLAKLVQDLNALDAHAIVIDQYFGADSCDEQDKNAKFVAAVEGSKVPVVVGQPTHALKTATATGGCLAPSEHLEFSKAANVLYGVTRLDSDDLKIPLRWPVFSDLADNQAATPAASTPKQLPVENGDSLALVAAKVQDPNIESDSSVGKLLGKWIYPYTTFIDLPEINAMAVMCSAEKEPKDVFGAKLGDVCTPWIKPLNNLDGHSLSLSGKVVVIGAVSPLDMQPFPTGQKPGVFLQANYVQSILDHRFLLEVPPGATLAGLVGFVLVVYCLYWAHDAQGRPRLTAEKAGLWSLAVFAALVLSSLFVLVTTSYFTPLWALFGAGVFMVFRYLEANGHHRSQHLIEQLAGHSHTTPAANEQGKKR